MGYIGFYASAICVQPGLLGTYNPLFSSNVIIYQLFTVAADDTKKILREHYLSTLNNRSRWEICIAAKRRFQRDVILDLIFSNNWYEIVRLYDIVYTDGNKKIEVAFMCSSIPKTYLRLFKRDSKKHFTIMIVQ